mgnify:FL=1
MRQFGIAAIALGVGALLGATAGARQAAVPKGYVIAQLTLRDAKAYADYAPKVPPVVTQYGGRYVVRGGAITPLEGMPPGQRVVVIEFASVAAATAFFQSSEYRALAPLRQAAAEGPVFIVAGVAP